ncbi:hypothetical protein V9T40_010619 [Parthenolecanium corni]|uniref:Amidase domain-containing protein n=1 Tax=Parthenolecanium corni TaxID=536013 RepID=A0AAN9T3W6_9HEMI
MSHCVGSKMRVGTKADSDGVAVANVRRAGAIPIAVTNTPELCASVETFNFVTGYTANPHDLSRSSGGSSGGEAALISCGSSPLGIGSDFAGSIRVPCLFTGIFGHKPSPGIVSNEGHYPSLADKEFQKLLTIGPMSRHAGDLRLALEVMAGDGASDLRLRTPVNVGELRIFYTAERTTLTEVSVDGDMKRAIKSALAHFESVRGCLVDQKESSLMVEGLKSLLRMSDYCLQTVAIRFIVETLLFIPRSKRFAYEAKRNDLRNALKDVLGENGVLLFPTFATPAFHKYELLWKVSSLHYPMVVNVLGFPATHIPAGLNANGLPIGFQVIAAPKQDRLCLAVAEELENVFGGWIAPKYVA